MNNTINLYDVYDLSKRIAIMEEFGNCKEMFTGTNEDGEYFSVSIYPDKIIVTTYQNNNWIRTNTYHADGTDEETFER